MSGGFLAGMVLGGLAGFALGMLSTPRTGEENREALVEKFPELTALASGSISLLTDEIKARLAEGQAAYVAASEATRQRMTVELEQAQHGQSPSP